MVPWPTELLPLLLLLLLLLSGAAAAVKPQVPEDFLIRLQAVHNSSQFLSGWVDQDALQRAYLVRDGEEAEAEIARPAGCVPEPQVVEFERPADPSLVVWPPCTRVRRCGGCCSSRLLHCVPTATSTVTARVIRARYPHPGAELLELEGYESVRLEQHDRCACRCRQEAADCTPAQRYQAARCQCVCRNQREAELCRAPDRLWDARECACRCRREPDCSTGTALNRDTCRCDAPGGVPERVPGPAPHLSTLFRDDGGENDAHRLRYAAADPYEGPFALFRHRQPDEDRTLPAENTTTHAPWTVT